MSKRKNKKQARMRGQCAWPEIPLAKPEPLITDQQYRAAAKELHEVEGEIEIDGNAAVSRGNYPGAWVRAWVWVPSDDARAESECKCVQPGKGGAGHGGGLTVVRFRRQVVKACENHLQN